MAQEKYTLIANSGIQVVKFPIILKMDGDKKKDLLFREWSEETNGETKYQLELISKLGKNNGFDDSEPSCFRAKDLLDNGLYYEDYPEKRHDIENCNINSFDIDNNEIFGIKFTSKVGSSTLLKLFENKWLPIPYFHKLTEYQIDFSPLNWARFKIVPVKKQNTDDNEKQYNVVLVFDTRSNYDGNALEEYPVFPGKFTQYMDFGLCGDEFMLMDYCSPDSKSSYVSDYIINLVYPKVRNVADIRNPKGKRMSCIAAYIYLIKYFADNKLFPDVRLYKDTEVEFKKVDMVVDIGNSKTTALLVEENGKTNDEIFTQVKHLELINWTRLLRGDVDNYIHNEPFDMRLVFRKVDFGIIGPENSKQFVYPSLVRLGIEANELMHQASTTLYTDKKESLATYSSPKRYLWDNHTSKEEWKFLVLGNEPDDHVLKIVGITDRLNNKGEVVQSDGGVKHNYSRCSLMTFSFLEMLVQAHIQINSEKYRDFFGNLPTPRKIQRVVITCPTAMSKEERESLTQCANDAVKLFEGFIKLDTNSMETSIEIRPLPASKRDEDENDWYYDEATCSQFVYMYGEVGYKYQGHCGEFFKLYGKKEEDDDKESITIGSLDIGAGTTDLMINKYTYSDGRGKTPTIKPDPKFHDSFYFAGDDMLYALVREIMLLGHNSAFRIALNTLSDKDYRQKMKDFFGKDNIDKSYSDKMLRRDFNIQYSVPLMSYFLQLLSSEDNKDFKVTYNAVFKDNKPAEYVIEGFKQHTDIDITKLVWKFNKEEVSDVIKKQFDGLIQKVATIMYSCACDIVLLSGRPASLSPIRDLFLKYYCVSPNRLILLNNYYVGDWYPFDDNTGYIKNAKTIVAMGGIIGNYSTEYSNINNFVIDLSSLRKNLKSTINYVYKNEESSYDYLITPQKSQAKVIVNGEPKILKVKQLDVSSYVGRPLYCIDFNREKIRDSILQQAIKRGDALSDSELLVRTENEVDKLKHRMPFTLTIHRDSDNKEKLIIDEIEDRAGEEVTESNIEVNIQSLTTGEYWLDNGVFDF